MGKTFKSFKYPLLLFTTLRLYSGSKHWRTRTSAIIFMALLIFNLCVMVIQCPYIEHNMLEIVATLEAVCIFVQIIGKVGVLLFNHIAFVDLIEHIKLCWKTKMCAEPLRTDLNRLLAYNLALQRCFFLATIMCIIATLARAIFQKGLLFGVWKIKGHNMLYLIVYIAQDLMLHVSSFFLTAFDCMYLACCVELVVQCRILKQGIKELDMSVVSNEKSTTGYLKKMQLYVERHNFVLRFHKAMQNFYSTVVVFEYCSISPIMCSEMYAIFDRMDAETLISCGPLFVAAVIQLAFYSIPADYVASEAEQVAYALYESNWYVRYVPKLRKPMILIIQQSNQRVTFIAGGFFGVNARALLTVLKISWSACTVLRAVKKNH